MKRYGNHPPTGPGLEVDILITQLEQDIQELRTGVHRVRNMLHCIYDPEAPAQGSQEAVQGRSCPVQGISEVCPCLDRIVR